MASSSPLGATVLGKGPLRGLYRLIFARLQGARRTRRFPETSIAGNQAQCGGTAIDTGQYLHLWSYSIIDKRLSAREVMNKDVHCICQQEPEIIWSRARKPRAHRNNSTAHVILHFRRLTRDGVCQILCRALDHDFLNSGYKSTRECKNEEE